MVYARNENDEKYCSEKKPNRGEHAKILPSQTRVDPKPLQVYDQSLTMCQSCCISGKGTASFAVGARVECHGGEI